MLLARTIEDTIRMRLHMRLSIHMLRSCDTYSTRFSNMFREEMQNSRCIHLCHCTQAPQVNPLIGPMDPSANHAISAHGWNTPCNEHPAIAGRPCSFQRWACAG